MPLQYKLYFICPSGLLTEWVWSIISRPVQGRDHLSDVGYVEVNVKVLGDLHTLTGIVEGKGHEEWFNLYVHVQVHKEET